MVANAQTGEPIKHALVQAVKMRNPEGAAGHSREPSVTTTFTDAGGAFHFALDPGVYRVTAVKPEFQDTQDEVELRASKSDLQLKLPPLGVITGKVVDQDGVPLRGVNVIALTSQIEEGWRRTRPTRNVSTDDRGMFRLWNLNPGKYYLKAAGRSGGTYSYVGDSTPQFFADESFAPAYFGGGQSLDSAPPVELVPGAEIHADLSLHLEPAYKIRGTLANYVPRRAVKFELLRGDEDVSPSRVSVNSDSGRFEIQDVIAGSYLLRATQDHSTAALPLQVNGIDVNGISLPLLPAADVKGSIRYTNAPPEAPRQFQGLRQGVGSICRVTLQSPGRRAGQLYAAVFGEAGEFTVKQVEPGTYHVAVFCFAGYANSVMSGTQDLLANPLLTVQPGGVSPIEVVATYGGGTIQGKIAPAASKEQTFQVLVVPQFTGSTGPAVFYGYRPQGDAGDGQFAAQGLAPGVYAIYVFSAGAEIEFRNPQFLQSLHGGTTVQVTADGQAKVNITELIR